jgi:hypothetical protein
MVSNATFNNIATTNLIDDKPISTNACGYISSNKERAIIRPHWMLLTNSFQTMKESVVVVIPQHKNYTKAHQADISLQRPSAKHLFHKLLHVRDVLMCKVFYATCICFSVNFTVYSLDGPSPYKLPLLYVNTPLNKLFILLICVNYLLNIDIYSNNNRSIKITTIL